MKSIGISIVPINFDRHKQLHEKELTMTIDDIADHMTRMHDFDYEECYEAIHAYCALNHSGQNSQLYRMLSTSDFKPGLMWSESQVESENMAYDHVKDAIETYVEFPDDDDDDE